LTNETKTTLTKEPETVTKTEKLHVATGGDGRTFFWFGRGHSFYNEKLARQRARTWRIRLVLTREDREYHLRNVRKWERKNQLARARRASRHAEERV
jgi:hypothetical protein